MIRYYVTRDTTDDYATDETRAMAHVSIARNLSSLAEAQDQLRNYLLNEASALIKGKDIQNERHLWAFERACDLAALSREVYRLDPMVNPGPRPAVVRVVGGLAFTIVAVERV